MKKLLLVLVFVLCLLPCSAEFNEVNKKLAEEIGHLYRNFDKMKAWRKAQLDSMLIVQKSLENSLERVILTQRIGNFYKESNIDSALLFWALALREAESLKMDAKAAELHMMLLSHSVLIEPDVQVIHSFQALDTAGMDRNLRKKYWANAARLNFYVQEPCESGEAKTFFLNRTIVAFDSLLKYFPPESVTSGVITARIQELRGDKTLAIASLLELLPYMTEDSEDYEEALRTITKYYSDKPMHRQLYATNILNLARSTMRRGIIRPRAMAEAGRLIYEEGHRSLGKSLILMAMTYKDPYIGTHRAMDYSEYVRYLDANTTRVRIWLFVIFVSLLAAIAVLVALLIIDYHKRKRTISNSDSEINSLKRNLEDAAKISAATGSLALIQQEHFKEFSMYVSRKLKAGQVKELYADIENGSFAAAQKEKFFSSFDEAFFSIFPDFLERVNSILQPGKELVLLPGERMSPELRIAAYMRLGITDSSKLSGLMSLSVNTIYAYRNRLKSRAVDRDGFENNIRHLYSSPGASSE